MIRTILNQAMQKGMLKDLEAYLDEKFFELSQIQEKSEYEEEERKSLELLRKENERLLAQREKLKNLESINTFGEYLRLFLDENEVSPSDVSKSTGIEYYKIVAVIQDTIPLLNIAPQLLSKLSKRVGLSLENSKSLIIKTLSLLEINPSTKEAMARYAPREGLEHKSKSMKDGTNELLMKASQKKPFSSQKNIAPKEEIEKYLNEYEKYFLQP
jgi:hypothetical protein